jgi:hypothetical protein
MTADRWPPRSGAARIRGFVVALAWAVGGVQLLAGCAGAGGSDHARASSAASSASTSTVSGGTQPGPVAHMEGWQRDGTGHGYYRWLARTTGDPPTVALENRNRGTASWRLPGPQGLIGGEARGAVEGYVSSQSPIVGHRESVYVSAPGARTVRIGIYRMGWYGGLGGRLMLETSALRVTHQPRCAHSSRTGLTQCDWRPTLSFAIPPALPSGVYIVKLTANDGAERDCIFVLRAARAAPLLVQLPTASWEAYNEWGGDSLYPGGELVRATRSTQGVEVSYDRPYDSQTGAGQFFIREVAMVRFLERHGYPVSYTTVDALDRDPAQALQARAFIDVGHSEYWSQRTEGALARARRHGVSLIFISSDTMAWRVRIRPAGAASSEHGAPDHVIVAYKEAAAADPDRRQPSGLFPGGGAALAGNAYDGCITPRLPASGPPSYRYYAWRPAPALAPAWLFAHSGVSAGTSIPGIVGYELDARASGAPVGTRVVGEGGAPCLPEHEPSAVYGDAAQTTLYTTRAGGVVFATGTLGWEYGLEAVPEASPDVPRNPDPRVVAITRNLLAHVLALHHAHR